MEGKKLITYRQLNELITKGYGQWFYNYDNAVMGKNTLFIDKEVNENILICPWGLDKLVRPTVDIYEEFMKRKAEEHQEGKESVKDYSDVFKTENTTATEESSSTEKESVGICRRTPQEIADFFNCYVCTDKNEILFVFPNEPTIKGNHWNDWNDLPSFGFSFYLDEHFHILPKDHNWRTLYRPHMEPLVMEEEDD